MSSPNTVVLIKEMASSTIKLTEKTMSFLHDHPLKHTVHLSIFICLLYSLPLPHTHTHIHTYVPKTFLIPHTSLNIVLLKRVESKH